MAAELVHRETPMEYFKALVDDVLERQQVRSSAETTFYVVNLLAGYASRGGASPVLTDEPLAVRLARALNAGGVEQREGLRGVGDASLFLAGFFSDSLKRSLVDVDYYVSLGGYAYGSLGQRDVNGCAEIFQELARKFVRFVDVLSEVSERSAVSAGNTELLRVYEKWLRTGSPRNGQLLVERGIVPNASIGSRFLQ
jgi:hypothetical protein